MEGYRAGKTYVSDSSPSNQHIQPLPYSMLHHGITTTTTSPANNFMNQHRSSFDFGELEEAIIFQGVQLRNDEARKSMPLFPYSFSDVYY
ncbi:hypothetical protein GIB67_008703 [Kingdonia uniflora]|uniref:Uncharacterized protein n=1 Tax=Kingdonia uniflora TaxID=39325 RepID=A0A7J7NGG8_9MAGN|nr:hypothetical protein GIB67_008703 [Kingdonia uniflora]